MKTEKKFQNDNEFSPRFLHTTSKYETANQVTNTTPGAYTMPLIIFLIIQFPPPRFLIINQRINNTKCFLNIFYFDDFTCVNIL